MSNQDVRGTATTSLPVQNVTRRRTKRQNHGLSGMIRGRHKADARQLDGRSALAIAMNAYRSDLLASLGGAENLSQQELTVVEICCKDWLILQSIDNYLLQAGLFNKRKRTAYPLTIQRQTIADGLTRRLLALGLTRRARPVKSLNELLNAKPAPTQATKETPTCGVT